MSKILKGLNEGRNYGRDSWDSNMPGYQGDYGGAENFGRRNREDDEHHEIDRRREQQLAQYNQSGKFWLKLKDSQRHLPAGPFTGKQAATTAALELLKQQPELKGNLLITAYGPDESQGVAEQQLDELTGWKQSTPQRTPAPAPKKLSAGELYTRSDDKRSMLQRQKDGGKKNWFIEGQGVAEGSGFDKWADDRAVSQLHKLKPRMVQDRKTGKWYDPKKEFEKKMNSPEVMAQMKRMATKEGKEDKIAQLKKDHETAVHWSKNETSPQKREAARQKAEKIKRHLDTQYKQGVAEGVGNFAKAMDTLGGWYQERDDEGGEVFYFDDREGGYYADGVVKHDPQTGKITVDFEDKSGEYGGDIKGTFDSIGGAMNALRGTFIARKGGGKAHNYDSLGGRDLAGPNHLYKTDKAGKKGTLTKSRMDQMKMSSQSHMRGGPKGVLPESGLAEGNDHSLKKVWDRYSKHLMAGRGYHTDIRQINKSGEILQNIRKYVKDHHGQKAVDDMERYAEKQKWNEGVAEGQLDELSPKTLASYKKKAGADATAADKRGDYTRGNKRMSGIMQATKKEFDNDKKQPVKEDIDLVYTKAKALLTQLDESIQQKVIHALKKSVDNDQLDENLNKWFKEKWVRFGPDGKIRGDCARGDDSEGKPKCLPQSKAHSLGKKGRASAASRKRREDPNPERSGKAINVNTKKKSNEGVAEGTDGWIGNPVKWKEAVHQAHGPDVVFKNYSHPGQPGKRSVHAWDANGKIVGVYQRHNKMGMVQPNLQGMAEGQLDEISQDTARSYAQKARSSQKDLINQTHRKGADTDKLNKKIQNRQQGLNRAHTDKRYYKDEQGLAEGQLDELSCWSGYHRVAGTKAGFPGSCAKNKTNEEQEHHSETCPHCGGEMVSEELMNEKKDACYYKVKSRYKVWPSAYASGALVKCRKSGADSWGNGGKKNESIEEDQLDEKWSQKYKDSINCNNPKGFSQKAHCAGKNESAIMKGLK